MYMTCSVSSQTTGTYLSATQAQELANVAKTGSLVVIIENEKSQLDAALLDAVKANWKINGVKYMSLLEFNEKFKANQLGTQNLYLYNLMSGFNATIYQRGYTLGMHNGYYLTTDPIKLTSAKKLSKAPPYLYFSGGNIASDKGFINKGFFQLMIKNFNYEIEYCKKADNFAKKKKYKQKGSYIFIKEEQEIKGKNLLLVKEQVQKKENEIDSKKKKSKKQNTKASDHEMAENAAKLYVVFPEDIDHALKKSDKSVMLYNGGTLYSAADGSAYITVKKTENKTGLLYAYYAVSLIGSIAFLVIMSKIL